MKRVYPIVAHLIIFVILPVCDVHALEIKENFNFYAGFDFIKKPGFAASYQPGYRVAKGIELFTEMGVILGTSGFFLQANTSPSNIGVIYRGCSAVGGELYAGYIYPRALFNLVQMGAAVSVRGEYARYFQTDLLFFYLSAAVTPILLFQLDEMTALKIGIPVSYCFRQELSYHIRIGAGVAFLIG